MEEKIQKDSVMIATLQFACVHAFIEIIHAEK